MKGRLILIITAFTVFTFIATNAYSRDMSYDLFFTKFGFFKNYTVDVDEEDYVFSKLRGLIAIQLEYNLNFNGILIGLGLESQLIMADIKGDVVNHFFVLPMTSIKYITPYFVYAGGGISGKYLFATGEYQTGEKAKKKMDLWVNGILGLYLPVQESISLFIEGRFGWNLTKKQFSEYEANNTTYHVDVNKTYETVIYFGFVFGIGTF